MNSPADPRPAACSGVPVWMLIAWTAVVSIVPTVVSCKALARANANSEAIHGHQDKMKSMDDRIFGNSHYSRYH